MKAVLLDTGVIVALLQRESPWHKECARLVSSLDRPLVTCEAVITETCHILRRFPGASEAVMTNLEQGEFEIPFALSQSVPEIRGIMRKYRDLPASFADACLVHMADELDTGDILTLDSDFVTYRWRKNRTFELLIPLKG
ncbi:MAG TPA: PIN domain-containing protein [Acidobacteriaceae bacterium]|nr:PIN domain-containing protein [Acidobacteriaceae bacterium]